MVTRVMYHELVFFSNAFLNVAFHSKLWCPCGVLASSPASHALLLLGLAAIGLRLRRKK